VLRPNGRLILSTPNIESTVSRVEFLLRGTFRWFREFDYQAWGHIQPLTSWQLDKATRRSGLRIDARTHNATGAVTFRDPGAKGVAIATVGLLVRPFIRGNKLGDVNIWTIAPSESTPD
jgi:hypothetical protein